MLLATTKLIAEAEREEQDLQWLKHTGTDHTSMKL